MKYIIDKNPIVTLLCHYTKKTPEDFRYEGVPEFRVSKKPEIWKPFFLPLSTNVTWMNFAQWGYLAPNEIELDADNLYYTDWNRKETLFSIETGKPFEFKK